MKSTSKKCLSWLLTATLLCSGVTVYATEEEVVQQEPTVVVDAPVIEETPEPTPIEEIVELPEEPTPEPVEESTTESTPEPAVSAGVAPADQDDSLLDEILPDVGMEDTSEEPSDVPDEEPAEDSLQEEEEKLVISISSLAELSMIGQSEDYPLDGTYELTADIYGGTLNPIGTAEAPFSGNFYGCGHVIGGLTISGGNAGFFGVLTGTVQDLTLTEMNVSGTTAGILAGSIQGGTVSNVLVTGTVSGSTAGAVAGSNSGTLNRVIYFTGTNLPAVGSGNGSGALMLRSQPPYIAIVMSQTAQLSADGNIGHFNFSHYESNGGFSVSGGVLTPETTGKFTLTAVYTCDVAGTTVTLKVDIPVIIGRDNSGLQEISTLDGVFYEQLQDYEVVQISALSPLQLLEGVFAETIIQEEETVATEEEDATINLISTWEQFKNIGNTEYNPNYTMYAVYLLSDDIVSDGEPFAPIGTEENPFYGEFDGRVYTIDLTANPEIDTTAEYSGLFGVVKRPE